MIGLILWAHLHHGLMPAKMWPWPPGVPIQVQNYRSEPFAFQSHGTTMVGQWSVEGSRCCWRMGFPGGGLYDVQCVDPVTGEGTGK